MSNEKNFWSRVIQRPAVKRCQDYSESTTCELALTSSWKRSLSQSRTHGYRQSRPRRRVHIIRVHHDPKSLDNGFPFDDANEFRSLVHEILNIFRTYFSKGPPANVPHLKIELSGSAKPICVKIRNYSQIQRQFLRRMTTKFVDAVLIYPNPTSIWAYAPDLIPKSDLD